MESGDVQRVERRARAAYELARLRRAAIAFAPMLLLVAVAAVFGDRVRPALALGTSLFIVGVSLLWYGHDIRRAELPGIAAGAVPLVLALCARHIPHGCTGDTCFTLDGRSVMLWVSCINASASRLPRGGPTAFHRRLLWEPRCYDGQIIDPKQYRDESG